MATTRLMPLHVGKGRDVSTAIADCLNGGIVVSGYRFEDMMYDELRQCLPGEFDMLLISSPARWSGQSPDRVICLPMPLKVHDLLNTLEMMVQDRKSVV